MMSFKERGPALLPALLMFSLVTGGLFFAPAARAQTTYVAALRGANEVPPVSSGASGTATLVLGADERSATLSLSYSGLSSAASAAHIHGPADPGISASVVKDIPRDPFDSFTWTFAPVGNLSVQDQVNALRAGRLYINVHSANHPNGEIRGNFYLVSQPGPGPDPGPVPDSPSDADAVRFLEQATFGPTAAGIKHLRRIGLRAWLDEQFATPLSGYDDVRLIFNSNGTLNADGYVGLQERFFQNAVEGADQLRQRVAFALNQILVVSANDLSNGRLTALLGYQKVIHENAFGNYRDLLHHMTLNPAMGRYLNMANNVKATSATGPQPNENYARELLQLFSIGVFQLNPDGSVQVDGEGRPLPTYGNAEITAFARALTGWTYANANGTAPSGGRNATPRYGSIDTAARSLTEYLPLVADPRTPLSNNNHDTGSKTLLNGAVAPAGQTAEQDLNAAIDNVFSHPNVGPFIGKQLIQKLVTSNPSPDYVRRVVQAFNNNGQGVRGDMKAVVRAILLDPEARGDGKTEPGYGHLREPALFIANLLRAFHAKGAGTIPFQGVPGLSASMGQNIFTSPTVFNFYLPDYRVNYEGQSLFAPEVQTLTTETTVRRINYVNTLLYGTITGVAVDISEWQALADDPAKLVDAINSRLMHGAMSADMKSRVVTAVNSVPAGSTQMRDRARMALYLVASSMQYQVQQ
jgi:uncharacterized protein (DUF1800 family)